MSAAVLMAAAAGCLAAAAIAEIAAARALRSRARRPRGAPLLRTLARVGHGLGPPRPPGALADRLAAAAAPVSLADVMALKAGGALAAAVASLPVAAGLPGRLAIAMPAAAAGAAFLAPDLWLARRARARGRRMTEELADVADLLRVAVDAGLAPRRALAEVGRRHGGVLAGELRRTAEELELGVPRSGALERLRLRAPLPAVAALATAVERAERLGTSPSEALAALAADARADHRRLLTERAARAAPQVQLVVALLLVPAAMLLVAAALVPSLVL